MSYLFSFSRYQTKCVIEFLFRQLMASWTLRFIFDHPLKQWPTGRKRGKGRNTKNWISWEWKELFRWNKKDFSQIFKGYHLVKNENLVKIADASFNSFYEVSFSWGCSVSFFLKNWDSFHARLNSHYKAWNSKKKNHKKIKAYRKYL